MPPIKTINVFGDRVDVFVDSATSNGASSAILHYAPPGGGPPPHSHTNEDETFTVIEGEFEILADGKWHPLAKGEIAYGPRGNTHTFRNSGKTPGILAIFIAPGGFENYLEEISQYSPITGLVKILEISKRYGIKFQL